LFYRQGRNIANTSLHDLYMAVSYTVLTPQITGHNLKNKLSLIKFVHHDKRRTVIG
jgi:hypothetical protein